MAIDVESESPLVGDYENHQRGSVNHERDVHILSCAFLLIFLAYGAAQNLESTINTVSFIFISLFVEPKYFCLFVSYLY